MTLHIGVARVDITPPVGIPMVGFAGRGPSIAVHDPLTATVLTLADGDDQAVLICTDLLQPQAETVATFRRAIAATTGIAPDRILLHSAHNHFGPDVDRAENAPMVDAYRANLEHLLAGAAFQALHDQRPVRMGIAWGASGIGINRREKKPDGRIVLGHNPDGPIDRQVGVVRFADPEGQPLATLVNFPCHPVCQSGQMRALSADFPGRMRQVVETLTHAPCLFLQGACGDINPIIMEHAYEPARTLGTRLGCEVVKVWETIEPGEASGIQVTSNTVSLPRYSFGSAANAAQLHDELERELKQLTEQESSAGHIEWAQRRLQRVTQAVDSWTSGDSQPPIDAELQALRLGELGIATAPGEIFNEIAQAIKASSPFSHTFFAGYANGSIGYVPVPAAYPEGGYEVTHACQVDPEAAGLIETGCLELLQSLAD